MKMSVWMLCLWCSLSFVPATAGQGSGVTSDKVVIGQVAGLSGPVAGSVKEQLDGARVYFKAVNDKGGVAGRRIELHTEDDGFDPKRTPEAANKLIRQGVLALFMVRGTGNTESLLPLLDKEGIPLIAPASGASSLHQPVRQWVFNVRAPYQMEVAAAVRHLATMNVTRLAMFHVDDAFGADALAGFNKALAEQGQTAALVQSYKRPAGDIASAVKHFVRAAPGAVFVIGSASETAHFIRQFHAAGSDLSRARLQAALESIRDFDMGGIVISYGPNDHSGSQFVETSIISASGRLIR